MINRVSAAAFAALAFAVPAAAQDASPIQAVLATPAPAAGTLSKLPANTELLVSMNQEVTTKGDRWKEGDTFEMSVVHDVTLGDLIVIPKGARAKGHIAWLTSKGAFGKSGKMDIVLDYVEMNGRRIPIAGEYRQEGEGNTVATVGGVVLAGVFAGFITGKSARIPQGRELSARTKEDLAVALPAGYTLPASATAVSATLAPAAAVVPAASTN